MVVPGAPKHQPRRVSGTHDRLSGERAGLTEVSGSGAACRCAFGARGGYGTQRIVDGLDVEAVRGDPKIFIGFSDLTCLHGKLSRAARLVSFYGPLAT